MYDKTIPIICDNTSVIIISKNHVLHSKTKHIPFKYNFLRDQLVDQIVKLEYITTKDHFFISLPSLFIENILSI